MSLASLGKKLRDIARENDEILDDIRNRMNERVICGYSYHFDYKTTQPAADGSISRRNGNRDDDDDDKPWKFKSTPLTQSIASSVASWHYTGEKKLKEIDDVFNDRINYSMTNFSDVVRLNAALLATGEKYATLLGDRPQVRRRLAIIVDNMTTVRCAIDDVRLTATRDAVDEWSEDVVAADATAVADAVRNVTRRLDDVAMSFRWKVRGKKYAPGVARADDGATIASFDGLSLKNSTTLKGHKSNVREVIYYEENGKPCLASCSLDKTIILWSLLDNTAITTLTGHEDYVYALATFESRGGSPRLASGCRDKSIKLWDLTEKVLLATLTGHASFVYSLVAYRCRDGAMRLASGSWDKSIKIWNVDDDDDDDNQRRLPGLLSTLNIETYDVYALKYLQIDDDTPCLAFGGADETIKIWNLNDNRLRAELRGHEKFVWKMETFTTADDNITYLISAGGDGKLMLWNLVDNSHVTTLEGHSSCVSAVTLVTTGGGGGDGPYLVSGDDRGSIKFWNLNAATTTGGGGDDDAEVVKEIDDNLTPVECLTAFRLDKKIHLASSCYDIVIYTLTEDIE